MTTQEHGVVDAPLSFGQEQLWFLDQLAPGTTTYNMLLAARVRGPLRLDLLERSLTLVAARHEALRATFHTADGVAFQRISPPGDVELEVVDRQGLEPAARATAIE